jgi:hypothetical protein
MQFSTFFLAMLLGGIAIGSTIVRGSTLSNPIADGAISIDTTRTDWNGIATYPGDGNEGYAVDIGTITMAHDSTNLYVRYQMNAPSPGFLTTAYNLLIDTDQSAATGYYGQAGHYQNALGAEKLIQGAHVHNFTGATQDAFSFTTSSPNDTSYNDVFPGTDLELRVSLASLGNPSQFNFILWIDSNGNTGIDSENSGGDEHLPNGAYNGTLANVHTYAVPEPAGLGLLCIGAMMLLRRRDHVSAADVKLNTP